MNINVKFVVGKGIHIMHTDSDNDIMIIHVIKIILLLLINTT